MPSQRRPKDIINNVMHGWCVCAFTHSVKEHTTNGVCVFSHTQRESTYNTQQTAPLLHTVVSAHTNRDILQSRVHDDV